MPSRAEQLVSGPITSDHQHPENEEWWRGGGEEERAVELFYSEKERLESVALCWCPPWIIDAGSNPDRYPIPHHTRPSHNVRTNFSKQWWCSFGRQSRAHSFKLKIWLFIADFNDKSPYLHEILFPIPNMELYPRDNSVCALNFYTRTLCRWPQASWSWLID